MTAPLRSRLGIGTTEPCDRALRNMPELLQALASWEFRPATKDGVPIMVEVLLCIPNVRT